MAIHKLKPVAVAKLGHGLHSDGGGLYLNVGRGGSRSWVLRFMLNGKAREMGLGSSSAVGLADARQKAQDARKQLAAGIDPITARDAVREARRVEVAKGVTFDQCANAFIESHKAGWKNAKHAAQWTSTIRTYASPLIGRLPVQDVDTELVLAVLKPIWTTKTETAHRVRGRIEQILDYAKTLKYRTGENPARWRGHLSHLLPPRGKVKRVRHHPALPYRDLPVFMTQVRAMNGLSARALEFTILTAARTNETINARWNDVDGKLWTVPAERMKAERDHRVPLSGSAVTVLKAIPRHGGYIFPGGTRKAPHMSNMAMLTLLGRMGRDDLTVHGFRSTFKDWARERTNYADEVSEAALAHVVGDETEAAYARGDLFEKRRKLMADWAAYCAGKPVRKRK